MIDEKKITSLETEQTNPKSRDIDVLSAQEIVNLINDEDQRVAEAVKKETGHITEAAVEMSKRYMKGGRIIYVGAGSSGRIGLLDSVELIPTYGIEADRTIALLAGGDEALFRAVENAEDSEKLAEEELKKYDVCEKDIVIGIAASGRTPYTISALRFSRNQGAYTIAVTMNDKSEMGNYADITIAPNVGPEVIAGSTRMKAGTAQKMVVNMLSTTCMILSGRVYKNQMVYVQATNEKLLLRSVNIVMNVTDSSRETAQSLLKEANGSVAAAIVMYETGLDVSAVGLLDKAKGNVRTAITGYSKEF